MSIDLNNSEQTADPTAQLRERCEQLERDIIQVRQRAEAGLVKAHLQAEAVKAGMIDIDGLKMLDLSQVSVNGDGEVSGAVALMEKMRKEKPWLFGRPSTSNPGAAPPAQPPRQKLATQMTDAEYKVAREAIVRYRP